MGRKALETTCNIHSWPRNCYQMYSAVVVQEVLQRRQEPWRLVGQWLPWEVDSDQLRGSSKLIFLQLQEKLPKNSVLTFLQSFSIWNSKLERWKASISGCLLSWSQVKKSSFWSVIFSYSTKQLQTIFRLDCDVRQKVDFTTTGDDQLSGWIEKKLQSTSKAKLAPKEGPGHCLMVSCRSDPLQLSESWWNHSICEVRSANRWDAPKTAMPAAGTGPQRGPDSLHPTLTARSTTNASKVEQIGPHSCLFRHIHLNSRQPTTTSSSIATTSCREISFTISRRQKMLSKSSRNPEAQIFMLWGINKVIFCWQKCVDCTGSYFDWWRCVWA